MELDSLVGSREIFFLENWREFCYFGGLGLEVGGCL